MQTTQSKYPTHVVDFFLGVLRIGWEGRFYVFDKGKQSHGEKIGEKETERTCRIGSVLSRRLKPLIYHRIRGCNSRKDSQVVNQLVLEYFIIDPKRKKKRKQKENEKGNKQSPHTEYSTQANPNQFARLADRMDRGCVVYIHTVRIWNTVIKSPRYL